MKILCIGQSAYDITLPVAGKVIIDAVEKNIPAGKYTFWGMKPE